LTRVLLTGTLPRKSALNVCDTLSDHPVIEFRLLTMDTDTVLNGHSHFGRHLPKDGIPTTLLNPGREATRPVVLRVIDGTPVPPRRCDLIFLSEKNPRRLG